MRACFIKKKKIAGKKHAEYSERMSLVAASRKKAKYYFLLPGNQHIPQGQWKPITLAGDNCMYFWCYQI